ncbi:MAG: aminotransferase class III-fold pyridoxal phosphate-dependent enzyme [Acidobacteriota bacterium]
MSEPGLVRKRSLERSQGLLRRAEKVIPCQTQCLSKGPTQLVQGVAPVYLEAGRGSRVWDVDGSEYIDYMSGLGPIILGYSFPAVNAAITEQLGRATTLSLMHPLEVEMAELLTEVIPCAEMARFGKNGSDATSAAIRIARAFTGRDHLAQSGYHGWQDWYVASTSRSRGVPKALAELIHPFRYNDLDSLRQVFKQHPGQVAAVIMEPVLTEAPRPAFLEEVKELARQEGALLVFDEVITGFRWALGGAQDYFRVTPDLACLGKSMSNGMPLSAVVGRADVMRECEDVFFSLTYGGECLSLAAGLATVKILRDPSVLDTVWRQGKKLQEGFARLAAEKGVGEYLACLGYPCRTTIRFLDAQKQPSLIIKSLFQQEVIKRGILCAGYHNMSYSHSDEDIDRTLRAYGEAMDVLAEALESPDPGRWLEGSPVQNVFRPVT